MNYSFELKDLLANYRNAVESKNDMLWDYAEEAKKQLLNNPNVTEKDLDEYERLRHASEYFYDNYASKHKIDEVIDCIRAGYNMFDKMARQLTYNLDAGKVEVIGDEIIFDGFGNRLSFTCNLLAKYFGFHCGTFTFDSSFTSHKAYTDDKNYEFEIGCTKDNRVIISFNLMRYADPKLVVGY